MERNQDEWAFDHKNEHKPDRTPRWVSLKHDGECGDMHHEKCRKGSPERARPKITLVLPKDEPKQSARLVKQSKPSSWNYYPVLAEMITAAPMTSRTTIAIPNKLRGFQD